MKNTNLNSDQHSLALKMLRRSQEELGHEFDMNGFSELLHTVQDQTDISSKEIKNKVIKLIEGQQ